MEIAEYRQLDYVLRVCPKTLDVTGDISPKRPVEQKSGSLSTLHTNSLNNNSVQLKNSEQSSNPKGTSDEQYCLVRARDVFRTLQDSDEYLLDGGESLHYEVSRYLDTAASLVDLVSLLGRIFRVSRAACSTALQR